MKAYDQMIIDDLRLQVAALRASHERLLEALTYLYRHAEERLSEHELEVADAAIAKAQKRPRWKSKEQINAK